MTDGHRSVLIRPIETGMERLRPRVESVLVEVFGPDVLHRDHDGDYLLNTVDGIQVCAQLVDGDAITLQIFGVLVSGVEKSHGLIEELNDYNTNIHFARVFWVSDQVLVEVDLLAATVDPEEVGTAFDRIAKFGRDLGPTVAAIYGGRLMVNDLAERWAGYHQATIIADTAPGVSVALNGPDAIEQWPYPEAVHVLTAWNPGGRIRSSDANQQDGNRLASLLYENGYDFHRARGGLADYWEEGVAVWGLEQESARELGRQFGQDAIFEIDENECRVVGCFADRVDGRPRISRDPIASTEAD